MCFAGLFVSSSPFVCFVYFVVRFIGRTRRYTIHTKQNTKVTFRGCEEKPNHETKHTKVNRIKPP